MSAPVPAFVRFVSSVEGRLVARWDAPKSSFGARVTGPEERKQGAPPILWDTAAVVPLTNEFCRKYDRELRGALRRGDLVERKREDYEGYLKAIDAAEQKRAAALAVDESSEVPGEAEQVGGFEGEESTEPVQQKNRKARS